MRNDAYFDIFIPSYHRPHNCITASFYCKTVGWPADRVHIFIDSETDDAEEYAKTAKELGCQLHIFDMADARARYDYVHRASASRRSAGQARNTFQDFARENGIGFYLVQDDDTQYFQVRWGKSIAIVPAPAETIKRTFFAVREFMEKHQIGLFGLSQTGDLIGGCDDYKIFRRKVMNTTFYLLPYIYRGERGVQDDDTSLFSGVMNEGLFTGSFRYGLVLQQILSATQPGGLTDLYNECKLLNKSLVVPIQYPTACCAERQERNGARLHHKLNNRYLWPCVLKRENAARGNIRWDSYPEDTPYTNEPVKRTYVLD